MVFSSPYKRAVDTVRHFADSYDYPIVLVDGFRERKIDSCWIEDYTKYSKMQWGDFDYKLTDGDRISWNRIKYGYPSLRSNLWFFRILADSVFNAMDCKVYI